MILFVGIDTELLLTDVAWVLLSLALSPVLGLFFSKQSFFLGGFVVLVVVVLRALVPRTGLRRILFLGVTLSVLRLVSALLIVGPTSTDIAIALASAARVRSLLPSVERPPSLWEAGVLFEPCPISIVGGGGEVVVLATAISRSCVLPESISTSWSLLESLLGVLRRCSCSLRSGSAILSSGERLSRDLSDPAGVTPSLTFVMTFLVCNCGGDWWVFGS
ncbi:BnaC06g26590D [Brassica napus]|uniref:(rape) hypothetical protein n=1 Tax=Brassica napus TaxID=3708 RepID=A0A078GTN5_BRANA|nr:unnamed protein product [Brassica napus]CDY28871.1 BnaC06g26590D [Brassica napus]